MLNLTNDTFAEIHYCCLSEKNVCSKSLTKNKRCSISNMTNRRDVGNNISIDCLLLSLNCSSTLRFTNPQNVHKTIEWICIHSSIMWLFNACMFSLQSYDIIFQQYNFVSTRFLNKGDMKPSSYTFSIFLFLWLGVILWTKVGGKLSLKIHNIQILRVI